MGSMMKHMSIGPKFIVSISLVALIIISIGLAVLYQQEETKMDTMLMGRGNIISTQVMISRAYITQNYVAKIKKSKAASRSRCSRTMRACRMPFRSLPRPCVKWARRPTVQASIMFVSSAKIP